MADVLTVLEQPDSIRNDGYDHHGRQRWLIAGETTDAMAVELLCVTEQNQTGDWTVFITIYWK